MYHLQAVQGDDTVYWTGKAGSGWVSGDINEAFSVSFAEANRKAKLFNERAALTGLIFKVI